MHFNEWKPCRSLPVDKGWAWVVLMASSVILIIVQGSLRTFGLFIVELQRNFETSSTTISIVLAAESISNCLSSFLAMNCLSNILSSRTLIIIGSLLSALCFILDSVASTALMLPFFHLLSGAGIAFSYGPCLVNISHYFKRYRGTANALVSCGSSIGQFLFSPLRIFLITQYGVNGALLVNSALFLQYFIGEHRLSQGLGLMYLFTGLLASLYYPFFGYIRDLTESYDVGYVINSVALIVSGVLFLSEACVKYKKSPGSDN
ncbi:unnamed protein product [Acanthosepion pharaonis]|uniref:Uncharacterized protein n=1 Tax=Acanthosepion pharaonis TaxID=158019 RepID=A0A812DNR1_ACAPH|nr:unnamed protein product [Sepia pharaonis]